MSENKLLQKWLNKLQQESWQLELLISGFAIFGLFNLKEFLTHYMEVFLANFHGDKTLAITYTMLSVSVLITQIFIINLLFHVVVRGLWIGAIGLRYVSGEIEYSKLKYNDKIINYYKKKVGSFDKYIIGLEKIASIIFSFTFLLFFVFISLFLFFAVTMLISVLIDRFNIKNSLTKFFFFGWMFIFGLVAFDFITLGLIKRIKQRHFAGLYLGIYKVVGIITLSFLWRPLLLNFLDQKYTKRVLIGIVPYILLLFFLSTGSINQYEYFSTIRETPNSEQLDMSNNLIDANSFNKKYYDSMRNMDKQTDFKVITSISLPSYKLKGNMLEVFVKYTLGTDLYIAHKDSTLIKFNEIGYYNTAFNGGEYSVFTKKEKKEIVNVYLKGLGKIDIKRKKTIKDSIYKSFKEKDRIAYAQNIHKIKTIISDEISFYIDEQLIDKSKVSLDFYIHPNAKEKGMLCFFPIDSLSLGRHTFSYHKKYLNNDEIEIYKVKIPFIYVGN